MKIYKFGGASVNSAEGVNRLARIVGNNTDNLVVVISAMGKTTNMLEARLDGQYTQGKRLPPRHSEKPLQR